MKVSKYKHKNNSKRKTRKIKGGGGGGMGVNILSGSNIRYINPVGVGGAGCRSDNTTGAGAYSLTTPLFYKGGTGMSGGGKRKGGKKKSRKLSGGGFWDFAKPFWNPNNPGAVGYENGNKVLAPSCKGISLSGLGSPVSTAGYQPDIKPWSAAFRNDNHLYQKGGGGGGGDKKNKRNKRNKRNTRKLKGGSVFGDILNFGRTAVHGIGTTFNNFRGVSNDIYAPSPSPLFGQFPRGYGEGKIIGGEKQFMDIKGYDIKNIYKNATSIAAK